MTDLMTLNEFIVYTVEYELKNYFHLLLKENYQGEDIDEETNNYMFCEYEYHLQYLIETWKNLIDEKFVGNFTIDYGRQDTFNALLEYAEEINLPMFDENWFDYIFEDSVLHTNNILK